MQNQDFPVSSIRRMKAVLELTGLSRATIYNKINPACKHYDSNFPKPIKLGERSIGFYAHEVQAWIESRRVMGA
jgi:prophage regulatory protein